MDPGKILTFHNPSNPEGYQGVALIFLQRDNHLISWRFAKDPETAERRAREWWEKYRDDYVEKIDKRRKTDPQVQLAVALEKLQNTLDQIEVIPGDA